MRTQSTEARQQQTQTRGERERVLRPLFAYMVGRGMRRAWLAQQLGISRALLWNYERGVNRMPADFIETACRIVGIPSSLIPIPEPRSLYIQQPRSVKSTMTTTAKGQHGDDSQQSQRRTRRTQPTTPDAPVAHHAARHGAASRSRSSSDATSTTSSRASADTASHAKRRVAATRNRTGLGDGLAVSGNL